MRVNFLNLKVFPNLIQMFMPNTKTILRASHYSLCVMARTDARVYSDTSYLVFELLIRH